MTVRAWLVVAALVLAGCAGEPFDPQAGDCLRIDEDAVEGDPTAEVTIVDCEDEHELEVFHTFELEMDQTRGEARVEAIAEACLGEAFTEYVGVPQEESELELLPLPPSDDDVADGDLTVRCTVRPSDGGTTTGSVRGAADV